MNKRYLVYQQVVSNQENSGNDVNISINVNIRNVKAKNKKEAIGKFMVEMSNKNYNKTLVPIAFELNTLKIID